MAKRTKKLLQTEEIQTFGEEGIRLNRFLSDSGACSRREADRLIEEGHVTVDGVRAGLGMKIAEGQTVLLDGKPVKREESLIFIALNKPRGIVCTTDRREKDNIIDFLKFDKRIYPIGRLDKDSEGLILLTNDGSIVNKILRAGNYHEKEYIVTVDKPLTADFIKSMEEGVPILDTVTRPCKLKALDKYTFQIILTQGLNRQIRRMCEYLGYKVLTLKRIRIMNIQLGYLQLGGYRNVTEKEIATLTEAIKDSANDEFTDEKYTEIKPDRKELKGKARTDYRKESWNRKDKAGKSLQNNKVAAKGNYKNIDDSGKVMSGDKMTSADKGRYADKLKSEDKRKPAYKTKSGDRMKSIDRRKSTDGVKSPDRTKYTDRIQSTDRRNSADSVKTSDRAKYADRLQSTDKRNSADSVKTSDRAKYTNRIKTTDRRNSADNVKTSDRTNYTDRIKTTDRRNSADSVKTSDRTNYTDRLKTTDRRNSADSVKTSDRAKYADRLKTTDRRNSTDNMKSSDKVKYTDKTKSADRRNSADGVKSPDRAKYTDRIKSTDRRNSIDSAKSSDRVKYTDKTKSGDTMKSTDRIKAADKLKYADRMKADKTFSPDKQKSADKQKRAFSHKENTAAKGKMQGRDKRY